MIYIIILLFMQISVQAAVLEEMDIAATLSGKKVGYFTGSFDPVHRAHIAICEQALTRCDYILVHPVWGGDIYKKRSSVAIRLEMLFHLFEEHPRIIVSRYTPKQLQDALKAVDATFIGVMGSDTALYLAPNPETSEVYMTGRKIPPEYEEHTWGSCMAIKVDSFILALRDGDDVTALNGMLRERPIIAYLALGDVNSISSTALKKSLQQNDSIDHYCVPKVIDIIKKNALYR